MVENMWENRLHNWVAKKLQDEQIGLEISYKCTNISVQILWFKARAQTMGLAKYYVARNYFEGMYASKSMFSVPDQVKALRRAGAAERQGL